MCNAKRLSSINIAFVERLEKMSVNNRVVRKVEAEKWEIEETFEIKLDKIKPDHMKTIDSFDIEISAITF